MRARSAVTETFSDFNTIAYLAETAVNEKLPRPSTRHLLSQCAFEG